MSKLTLAQTNLASEREHLLKAVRKLIIYYNLLLTFILLNGVYVWICVFVYADAFNTPVALQAENSNSWIITQ